MPTKTWVVGEEVLAADFNTMVQKQVVATFANAAARDAALAAPNAGMMCWLNSPKALQVHDGTTWQTVPGAGAPAVAVAAMGTPSGGVGASPTPIGALSVTYAAAGGRKVYVSGLVTVTQATSASNVHVTIREGGTKLTESVISLGPGGFASVPVGMMLTPAAGAHTYGIYLATDAGTVSVYAAPDFISYLMAEDKGI